MKTFYECWNCKKMFTKGVFYQSGMDKYPWCLSCINWKASLEDYRFIYMMKEVK